MKRIYAIALVLTLVGALAFAAGSKESVNTLTVGATPEPHATFLNLIVDDLAAQGITLKVVEFTDYVTPNKALEEGQIDANFFQHIPYLESFNQEQGYHLANAGGIHIEPIALYSRKYASVDALPAGATIAIPNDPTNGGRALLLLQSANLITLSADAGITATVFDIVSNPKNLKFREIEAASLPRVLADVDAAVINGNYALPAGLKANQDGLVIEGADSPYVNVVAVRQGSENDPAIKALVKALQSQKIKDYVNKTYLNGEVVVVF
ncbi:MAG: MetQ/NlpA family ABC transporter substrate-binding protein [Sphaerochaetaceae bacterium]